VGGLIDLVPLPYTDAVVVLGAAILGVAAGVLGAFAVLRRRALVGDAVAHAALPGVCVAFLATGAQDAGTLLVGAAAAGLVAALLMVAIERGGRLRPDAAIGVVLAGFFSLGIVLLTAISHGTDAGSAGLERYLFGQAAGLLERDLVVMAGLAAAGIATVALLFRALKATLFDPGFAASLGLPVRALEVAMTALLVVAVVIGVRAVGAILMVALLVVPTVAARQLTGRLATMLPLAGLLGAAVGVTGALVSVRAALPTGPVIVLVGFALVVAVLALAPRRGVLWRARRLAAERRRVAAEALLLALLAGDPPPAPPRRVVADLRRRGLVRREELALTAAGVEAARAARERRRLWTLWLEHGWRLALPDAREPDPRDPAASLGEEGARRLLALEATA